MSFNCDGSPLGKEGFYEKSVTIRHGTLVWILVAFGFLVVGLVGGTIVFAWKREWAWLVPVASFVGYLLSFRRGLILRNPAVDRPWRRYLCREGEMIAEEDAVPRVAEDPENTLKIVRPGMRRPRHGVRPVR